jgi:hypothetical protein
LCCYTLNRYWADTDSDTSYLGGLNTGHLLFNWHPVLMVSGLILCAILSLMSFRILPFEKLARKYVHATLHTLTIICVSLGLTAVFQCLELLFVYSNWQYFTNIPNYIIKPTITQTRVLMTVTLQIYIPYIHVWEFLRSFFMARIIFWALPVFCCTIHWKFLKMWRLQLCHITFFWEF